MSSAIEEEKTSVRGYSKKFIQNLLDRDQLKCLAVVKDGKREINVVARRDFRKKDYNKVIVVAGGLSGNEPGFAGFVGSGMLTAAICSDAFEPLADISILKSLRSLLRHKESASGSKGCLIILQGNKDNNQNFRSAKIKAGLMVDMLFVEDDCSSFPHSEEGCKGLAGAVLLYKIAGAAAEKGKSLADVLQLSEDAARNIGTVGVASSPAAGRIYYGIGIHAGVVRDREFEGSANVISQCVSHILSKIHLSPDDNESLESWGFVVMVNGFSVTAENILSSVAKQAASKLRQLIINDLVPIDSLEGIFMTSLTMSGFSVTIMKLTRETLQLLRDQSSAPYWRCSDKLEYLNDFLSTKPLVSFQVPVTVMNKVHSIFILPGVMLGLLEQLSMCLLSFHLYLLKK